MKLNRTYILVLVFAFSSCDNKATDLEKEKALERTEFDQQVIKNIGKYESLKKFLINNLNEIYNQKNASSIPLKNRTSLHFSISNSTNISLIPNSMRTKFDSIINDLGKNSLSGFTIFPFDSTLVFDIRSDYLANNISLSHSITWNKNGKIKKDFSFYKDTLIENEWTYRIRVLLNNGW
jgi:hypothetical protein